MLTCGSVEASGCSATPGRWPPTGGVPAPRAPAQDIVPERKSCHAQFQTRVVDCGNLSEINFPFTSIVDFGLRN